MCLCACAHVRVCTPSRRAQTAASTAAQRRLGTQTPRALQQRKRPQIQRARTHTPTPTPTPTNAHTHTHTHTRTLTRPLTQAHTDVHAYAGRPLFYLLCARMQLGARTSTHTFAHKQAPTAHSVGRSPRRVGAYAAASARQHSRRERAGAGSNASGNHSSASGNHACASGNHSRLENFSVNRFFDFHLGDVVRHAVSCSKPMRRNGHRSGYEFRRSGYEFCR
jgi:hypothetical protein